MAKRKMTIWVEKEELESLKKNAARVGSSVSEFARNLLMSQISLGTRNDFSEIREIVESELRKIRTGMEIPMQSSQSKTEKLPVFLIEHVVMATELLIQINTAISPTTMKPETAGERVRIAKQKAEILLKKYKELT
jgi:hypothetical protein